jgi:hypothetical protein
MRNNILEKNSSGPYDQKIFLGVVDFLRNSLLKEKGFIDFFVKKLDQI